MPMHVRPHAQLQRPPIFVPVSNGANAPIGGILPLPSQEATSAARYARKNKVCTIYAMWALKGLLLALVASTVTVVLLGATVGPAARTALRWVGRPWGGGKLFSGLSTLLLHTTVYLGRNTRRIPH